MEFIKKIFRSTNGTLNASMLIILGISLLFQFPGNELVAIVTGIISFIGLVREWLKSDFKFEWASNAVAYIVAGLSALFPLLAGLFEAGADLVEAILSGNINLIIAAGIVFLNILLQQFGKKKEEQA
jgi:predicted membrane channel-forming protein YqfA (hemolysin III family)